MGFNFGAFAAGAVSGAGEIMEKQHKETKDSIDSNMKFAYEQGLPFHRKRQERLRKLTGMASDVASLGLNADQVNAVMGQSETQIQKFIDSSIAQKQRVPTFDPATQVDMAAGGTITPWEDVQMGSIDLPSIKVATPPAHKSIFASMFGGKSSDRGFESLRDRAEKQMTSVTGTGYNQVAAAAQGAYTYGPRTDATINLVNSTASTQAEMNAISLANMRKLGSTTVDAQIFSLQRARTDAERSDRLQPLLDKKNELEMLVTNEKIKTNVDIKIIESQLAEIEYKTKVRQYGQTPEQGLYITQHAILEEQLSKDPDPVKLEALIKTRSFIEVALAEQAAREVNSSATVSFGQYNTHFATTWARLLTSTVSDDNLWVTNEQTGLTDFDYSKKQAVHYKKAAMQKAMTQMIDNARKTGEPVSGHFKNWLGLHADLYKGDVEALTSSAMLPKDASSIQPDVTYAFRDVADIPEGATVVRKDGKKWGWSLQTPTGNVVVKDVVIFGTAKGSSIIERIANNKEKNLALKEADIKRTTANQSLTAIDTADETEALRAEFLNPTTLTPTSTKRFGRSGQSSSSVDIDNVKPGVLDASFASVQAGIDQLNEYKKQAKINQAGITSGVRNQLDTLHNKLFKQFNKGTYDPLTVQAELDYLIDNGISEKRMMKALGWKNSLSAAVK